jgi:hypothetical protein
MLKYVVWMKKIVLIKEKWKTWTILKIWIIIIKERNVLLKKKQERNVNTNCHTQDLNYHTNCQCVLCLNPLIEYATVFQFNEQDHTTSGPRAVAEPHENKKEQMHFF